MPVGIVNHFFIDQAGGTGDTYGVLGGARNGVNTTFTVSQSEYSSGTLYVFLNGQLLTQGSSEDWVETDPASGTFDFAVAPAATDEITTGYGYGGLGATTSTNVALIYDAVSDVEDNVALVQDAWTDFGDEQSFDTIYNNSIVAINVEAGCLVGQRRITKGLLRE